MSDIRKWTKKKQEKKKEGDGGEVISFHCFLPSLNPSFCLVDGGSEHGSLVWTSVLPLSSEETESSRSGHETRVNPEFGTGPYLSS